jgi:hypothetical protein
MKAMAEASRELRPLDGDFLGVIPCSKLQETDADAVSRGGSLVLKSQNKEIETRSPGSALA